MIKRELKYIRKDHHVYEVIRVRDKDGKDTEEVSCLVVDNFPSISKAKQFCRPHPLGVVRRYVSLERELGKQAMKELFK